MPNPVNAVLARLCTGLTDSNPTRGISRLCPPLFVSVQLYCPPETKKRVVFTGHTERYGVVVAPILHIQEVPGMDHASEADYSISVFRKYLQANSGIRAETVSITITPNHL